MPFGFVVSLILHTSLLAWAFVSIQSTKPLDQKETTPITVAIIKASELTRLKQGDPNAKKLEAKLKVDPDAKVTKKEAPKPKPVVAPPPPAVEPPEPEVDPIAEKLAEAKAAEEIAAALAKKKAAEAAAVALAKKKAADAAAKKAAEAAKKKAEAKKESRGEKESRRKEKSRGEKEESQRTR